MISKMLRVNNHPNYISFISRRNISINYGGLFTEASPCVGPLRAMSRPATPGNYARRNTIAWQRRRKWKTYLACDASIVHWGCQVATNINYLRRAIQFINYKCHIMGWHLHSMCRCVSFEKTKRKPWLSLVPIPPVFNVCTKSVHR